MRELESTLQFGEFLLRARLVKENAAPHCVAWVRRLLTAPACDGALADRTRRFCEDLERRGMADRQVRQAEQAIRIYFVNFLKRTDWQEASRTAVDPHGQVDPLAIVDLRRRRIRTRHYSRRTETSYAEWVRRFCEYLARRQGVAQPAIDSGSPAIT